jgi:hypothetical protein
MHACIQTYPVSSNAKLTCHSCTQHECGQMHLGTFERTRAEPSRDLFLGHFSSPFPHFHCSAIHFLPLFLRLSTSKLPKIQNPPPPITSPPPTVPPPAFLHHPHPPPATISPHFSIFSTKKPETQFFQITPIFSFIFAIFGHKSILGLCPLLLVLVLCDLCRGLG